MGQDRRHGCNAYCAGEEHCDLLYTPEWYDSPIALAKQIEHRLRVVVVRVEPAREAPALDEIPAANRQCLVGATPQDGARWLVWWQRPAGRWVPSSQGELKNRIASYTGKEDTP